MLTLNLYLCSLSCLQNAKAQKAKADKLELEREIHLVRAPAALLAGQKEKLRVAAEERQAAEDMQE
jgi:hypothetical protein